MADNAVTEAPKPAAVAKVEDSAEVVTEAGDAVADSANGSAKAGNAADVKASESAKDTGGAAVEPTETEACAAAKDKSEKRESNGHSDRKPRYDDKKGDRRSGRSGYGHGEKRSYNNTKNTEFDDLPETDDPAEIRSQVEFYFSLQNLRTDEHMFCEIDGANNRPVSIKHLHSFKRMRRFQPYSAVVSALRDSEDLVVVEDGKFMGAGNEGVKRKEPLNIPVHEEDKVNHPRAIDLFRRMKYQSNNSLASSIYAKGFGPEEKAGQIALENFFKAYGAVMVRKRRDDDNNWKGSVFVEFDNEDSAKQFLELDPKPKFNDHELTIMSKKEYSEMKCKEKGITPAWERDSNTRERRHFPRDSHRDNNRDRRGGRGGRARGRGYRRQDDRSGHRGRRDRSESRSSQDSGDWNGRRDKFQNSKDYRASRKNDRQRSATPDGNRRNDQGIVVDDSGVPVIRDTRGDKSVKRKADHDHEGVPPKKTKVEIKEDA